MKILIGCLLLIGATQAVDWSQVHHVMPSVVPRATAPLTNDRIIGGTQATPGQFPYQVAIVVDGTIFCGGSLISPRTVLTGSRCVYNNDLIEVHAGVQNIYNTEEVGRVTITTRDYKEHEQYNSLTFSNDIALVFLLQSISGPNIGIVRLPSFSMAGDLLQGVTARASGWGRVSDINPNLSDELQYVDVSIISTAQCSAVYGDIITDCNICTDTADGTTGICDGDFGGPLTITEADGIVTQVGITSFVASPGCKSGYPHGNCRITCYLGWIREHAPEVVIRP